MKKHSSRGHEKPSHNGTTSLNQPLAERFKEDIYASPAGSILGELFQALSEKENFEDRYLDVLKNYGYGDFKDEDYSYVLGFQADSILEASQQNRTNTAKAARGTTAPFHIRVYGAVYVVDAPSSELVVNPQCGAITSDDVTTLLLLTIQILTRRKPL